MDLLVLSSPLTAETEGMIGAAQLAVMRSDAVLVNVSRGQLVDQDALIDALREDRLAGACLDVFVEEPLPASSPLWDLDNVLVSPHSASTVASENEDLVTLFLENLGRWRAGRPCATSTTARWATRPPGFSFSKHYVLTRVLVVC